MTPRRLALDVQLARGALVCPQTRRRLFRDGDRLRTGDGRSSYRVAGDVPVLLADPVRVAALLGSDEARMVREYSESSANDGAPTARRRLSAWLARRAAAVRAPAAERAFRALFRGLEDDALCVAVGGGPTRADPCLVNLNLGLFANVDIVADAYALPYAEDAVDGVHCEAVLEHLEFPDRAVGEMHRVLRAGRRVYAATPFLQAYHGYPDHFQNFTLSGHRRLFERAGFVIEDAGCAVGPVLALRDLIGAALRHGAPARFAGWLYAAWMIGSLPLLRLDRRAAAGSAGARVASLTYLVARKPG